MLLIYAKKIHSFQFPAEKITGGIAVALSLLFKSRIGIHHFIRLDNNKGQITSFQNPGNTGPVSPNSRRDIKK